MTKKSLLSSIALFSLFLISCGSRVVQDGSSSAGTGYDPCDLITAEDVAGVFPGAVVVNTTHDLEANAVGQKICFYSASETDMQFVQISVINGADMNAGGLTVSELFANTKAMVEGAVDVSGLGDSAYYGGSGLRLGAGTNVLVTDKNMSFTIDLGLGFGNTDDASHMSIENALAQKVISRL